MQETPQPPSPPILRERNLGTFVWLPLKELNLLVCSLRDRRHDALSFLHESGITTDNPLYAQAKTAADRLTDRADELQDLGQRVNHGEADTETLALEALRDLRAAISTHPTTPGFLDRAAAYAALEKADKVLAQAAIGKPQGA